MAQRTDHEPKVSLTPEPSFLDKMANKCAITLVTSGVSIITAKKKGGKEVQP